MKKECPESFNAGFLNILLPALPVLSQTLRFREAFFTGALTAVLFWIAASFFAVSGRFFPKWIQEIAMILGITALSQASVCMAGLTPLAALALYLFEGSGSFPTPHLFLFLNEDEKTGQNAPWKEIFLKGFYFWMLLAYLGIAQEILGWRLHIAAFQQPFGAFFLMGLIAIYRLLPVQEGKMQKA